RHLRGLQGGRGVSKAAAAGCHRAADCGLRHARAPARVDRARVRERAFSRRPETGAVLNMAKAAKPRINKLVVIGVGLIGGSFALALKKARLVREVTGVGRSRKNLNDALRLGVIDRAETDAAKAVAGADLVLVGAPVGQMPGIFARIAPALSPQTVVTDAGSTKQDVIAAAPRHLGAHFPMFVPAHPIAGTEHSGAA